MRRTRQRTAWPGEINHDAFDRFTIGHAAVGTIMGLARAPWWFALGVAIGWEILERPLKDEFPRLFPHATQDTAANVVVDAAAMMVGWGLIQLFPRR